MIEIEMIPINPASMLFEDSGKGPGGIPSQTNLFKVTIYCSMFYEDFDLGD